MFDKIGEGLIGKVENIILNKDKMIREAKEAKEREKATKYMLE